MKIWYFAALAVLCFAVPSHAQKVTARPATPQPGRFDSQIRNQVEQLLHSHKEYAEVVSDVDAAVVTLTGKVPLYRDRKTLVDTVLRMPHVETVRDQIELAEPVPSDKILMGRLAERLHDLMPEGAHYQAHEGRVRLTGTVKDQIAWSRIVSAVSTTPGVQEVEDRLTIAERDPH